MKRAENWIGWGIPLLGLIVFCGSLLTPYLKERNRKSCILNIRNVQQTMRGHEGIFNMETGMDFDVGEYMTLPTCPSGGVYTYLSYNPKVGVLYCTCSHAKTKGHEPPDYSDW